MSILYTNARIFAGEQVLERSSVVVENGRFIEVKSERLTLSETLTTPTSSETLTNAAKIIDLKGLSVAPAFIDLQVYGGNGKHFNNEPTAEAIVWEKSRRAMRRILWCSTRPWN